MQPLHIGIVLPHYSWCRCSKVSITDPYRSRQINNPIVPSPNLIVSIHHHSREPSFTHHIYIHTYTINKIDMIYKLYMSLLAVRNPSRKGVVSWRWILMNLFWRARIWRALAFGTITAGAAGLAKWEKPWENRGEWWVSMVKTMGNMVLMKVQKPFNG